MEKKEFTIKSFYYDNINGYYKHNKKKTAILYKNKYDKTNAMKRTNWLKLYHAYKGGYYNEYQITRNKNYFMYEIKMKTARLTL